MVLAMKRAMKRRDAGRPRGAAVVDAVMLCTLDELAAHGLAELSVERIATSADVNKTTIYRRWPTREALVAGALEYVMLDLSGARTDTGSLRGDLLALGSEIAEFMAQPWGRALARAALAESSGRAVADLAAEQLERGASLPVAELVLRAQRRGEWTSKAPPEVALAMLVGAILHRAMLEHQPTDAGWLEAVVDIIVGGVARTSGKRGHSHEGR
jgi:AcrR family transcriptional regulator